MSLCVCEREGGGELEGGKGSRGKAEGGKGGESGMVESPYLVLELAGPMSAECYQPHCLQRTGTCQCVPLLDWIC